MEFKQIDLKNLNQEQKRIVKYLNNMIIEHQQVFQEQPEELLITKKDFELITKEEVKYLLLGKIKIYKV